MAENKNIITISQFCQALENHPDLYVVSKRRTSTSCSVRCVFDKQIFDIDYEYAYCLEINTSNYELLNKLIPIFNEIMGIDIFLSYSIMGKTGFKQYYSQWYINPYEHVNNIQECAKNCLEAYYNPKYYVPKTPLLKGRGIYPGKASEFIDFDNLEELHVFLAIIHHECLLNEKMCSYSYWVINKIYSGDLEEARYTLDFLIRYSGQFHHNYQEWYKRWESLWGKISEDERYLFWSLYLNKTALDKNEIKKIRSLGCINYKVR